MAIGLENADILAVIKLGGIDEFNQDMAGINRKAQESSQALATAVNVGIAAGAAALGLAVSNAASFERSMANVNTIVNLDPSGLAKMSESVKQIAMVNPVNMESLTSGLYDLVSSGAPAAMATDMLASAARAASAGLTGVDTAIRAGMANINAYGLPMSELKRVFDLQFQTVNIGVTSYAGLAGALGNVLSAANNLKVPMEELYGSIAQLTLSGIDPNSATTYLGRLFGEMIAKKDDLADAGAKVFDATGKFRGLVPFLQDINTVVSSMTPEQRASFFEGLGFTEQSNKAMLALTTNLNSDSGFINTMKKMGEAPGAVSRAFAEQSDTLSAQAATFKNIIQVNFIDIGNGLLPILKGLNDIAIQNPEATRTFASAIGTIAIGFAALAAAYKGVTVLNGMFTALAASPIGIIGLGLGTVAIAIGAIASAVKAHDTSVIDAIGATSDNIDKVGQLADTVETLRGKKELTKEETIRLRDAEKELQTMLGAVGLDLGDFKGKLDTVTGAFGSVREAQLLWDLYQLEKDLGSGGTIASGIASGVAMIAPALSGMITDVAVNRTGAMAERIKAIKDELEEIAQKKNVDNVKGGFKGIGDEAGGTDGSGGAAKKVNALGIELEKWKGMTEEQRKQEAFRDVTKALADNAAAAATNFDTFIAKVSADPEPVSDFITMIGTNNTGLSGGIRGLGSNANLVTLPASGLSALPGKIKDIGDKSKDAKDYTGAFGDALSQIVDASGDKNLKTGLGIIQNLVGSFMAGGVQGLVITGFGTLVSSLLSLGKDEKAALTVEQVISSLGDLGTTAGALNDFDFSEWDFIPFLEDAQERIDTLLNQGSKLNSFQRTELQMLVGMMQPIKDMADGLQAMDSIGDATDNAIGFYRNYTDLFGSGNMQAANDAMIYASQGILNQLLNLDAGTKAYDSALYNLARIRAEWGQSAQGLEMFIGEDAADQVQSYIDLINKFGDAAYDAASGIRSFTVELDGMSKLMSGQFDQFEKDAKAAATIVEKLLYFKIDVNTTQADEKVASAIQMMDDFAGTLDKSSKAYSDIKDQILQLSIKYAATGASANEEAVALAQMIIDLQDHLGEATGKEREAMQQTIDSMIKQFGQLKDVVGQATDKVNGLSGAVSDIPAAEIYVPIVMNPTGVVTPGQVTKLHDGGFPVAHDGYLAPNETFVKMLKNEMVLRPEATDKFGMSRLREFNATLDPDSLSGGSRAQSPVVLNIVAGNTTPDTWFKVSDQYIQPRINERTRRFEVKENPYAK